MASYGCLDPDAYDHIQYVYNTLHTSPIHIVSCIGLTDFWELLLTKALENFIPEQLGA